MYLYIYIYIYTSMYIHTYICVDKYMCVCTHNVLIQTNIHTNLHENTSHKHTRTVITMIPCWFLFSRFSCTLRASGFVHHCKTCANYVPSASCEQGLQIVSTQPVSRARHSLKLANVWRAAKMRLFSTRGFWPHSDLFLAHQDRISLNTTAHAATTNTTHKERAHGSNSYLPCHKAAAGFAGSAGSATDLPVGPRPQSSFSRKFSNSRYQSCSTAQEQPPPANMGPKATQEVWCLFRPFTDSWSNPLSIKGAPSFGPIMIYASSTYQPDIYFSRRLRNRRRDNVINEESL